MTGAAVGVGLKVPAVYGAFMATGRFICIPLPPCIGMCICGMVEFT